MPICVFSLWVSAPLTKVGFWYLFIFFLTAASSATFVVSTHMLSRCVREIADYRWPPIAVNRSLSAEINFQLSTLNLKLHLECKVHFLIPHQQGQRASIVRFLLYGLLWRLYRFIFIAYAMRWQISSLRKYFTQALMYVCIKNLKMSVEFILRLMIICYLYNPNDRC